MKPMTTLQLIVLLAVFDVLVIVFCPRKAEPPVVEPPKPVAPMVEVLQVAFNKDGTLRYVSINADGNTWFSHAGGPMVLQSKEDK